MKNIFTSILVFLAISCSPDKQPILNSTTSSPAIAMEMDFNKNLIPKEPYELKVALNKLDTDIYNLVVRMKLNNAAYFVSPNAKRDFKGKFTITLDENNVLEPISKLIETPISVEEIDSHPFVNGTVNWVRVNTNYHLKLKRTQTEKFRINGLIRFTIEPRCTLEKIPITMSYKDGQMLVTIDNC